MERPRLRLVNQAVTVKGRGRIGVSVSRTGEHIQVVVTGKIALVVLAS